MLETLKAIGDAIGFDGAQFITHAIGFLITMWLLKRFAWTPLLDLMEERRSKIAGEFETIEQEKEKAAALYSDYEARLKEIDNERRQKLIEAVEEGKKVAADIKAATVIEVKKLRDKTKADLEREVDKARVQLRQELVALTITAAEHLIKDRLDDDKHRDLINGYIDELERAR